MKLLIYYGLYEGEKAIAPHALGQLLTILAGHEVDVLILDDASPSRVGMTGTIYMCIVAVCCLILNMSSVYRNTTGFFFRCIID